jgi:hypothetical protein
MNFDLSRVRPDALSSYLQANEWINQGQGTSLNGLALSHIWAKGEYEVSVPLRVDFQDYLRRVAEVVDTIRRAEGRDSVEVASDLVNSGYDVVRVRILSTQSQEGVLPLDEAAEFVSKSRDMLLAAACSVVSPKIFYPARKPNQATGFIRRVKFGQTQRGSFVFSLMSPIAPKLADTGQQALVHDPFERQVTKKLLTAVGRVKTAASEAFTSRSLDLFEKESVHGISANLCAALAGLAGVEENEHDVELSFSWALVNPAGLSSQSELLPRGYAPIIRSAAEALRAKAPIDDHQILGPVLVLKRDDGAVQGEVTVASNVNGQIRNVRLTLSGSDYDAALKAHSSQSALTAAGTLNKEGKLYRLNAPKDVREVDYDEFAGESPY